MTLNHSSTVPYSLAEAIGCEVTKWIPTETNRWEFDTDFLEKDIKPTTKLLVISFPNNPTGYKPSLAEFNRIMAFAKKHNLYIFSDEIYYLLDFDSETKLPSVCEVYEKAVVLFGMPKTFGLAGLNIGWIITKDKTLYDKMIAFKDFIAVGNSAPSEILAYIALQAKEEIIDTNLKTIKSNLVILNSFFEKYRNLFSWIQPSAGTVAFPKANTVKDSAEFCERVLTDTGILLIPSVIFDYDNSHFRIGFGRKNMQEVLTLFDTYLQSLAETHISND